MKGDTEVVLMIVFFIVGAAVVAYAEELSLIPYLNTILGAAATLAAAFFGAKYAFQLQLESLKQKEVKDQVEAGNKAIFELVRTYNQFLAVRNQFIDEHRQSPGKHVFILPMAGNLHVMQLNFDNLTFLFDAADPDLLGRLALFQREVASTIDVIAQRSQLHVDVIQPAVERLEEEVGEAIQLGQLEKALGKRNTQTVKMLTDFMIEGVDGLIAGSERYINELNKILKEKFRGHKIMGMIAPNQSMQPTPNNGAADA